MQLLFNKRKQLNTINKINES